MKGTYWYAVDYAGTGASFYPTSPKGMRGSGTGEEALQISQGALPGGIPQDTWQDSPVVVTLEVLPCEETFLPAPVKELRLYPEKISPFPPERKNK